MNSHHASHITEITPARSGSTATPRLTPVDPLRLLRRYRTLLIVMTLLGAIVGGVATFILAQVAPEYQAAATLRVIGQMTNPYATTTPSAGEERNLQTEMRTQAYVIASEGVLKAALGQRDVTQTQWYRQFQVKDPGTGEQRFNVDAALGDLQKIISVDAVRNTAILEVAVSASVPEDAQILANNIARVYLDKVELQNQSNSNQLVELFTGYRNRAQQDITNIERSMRSIMDDAQLSATEDRHNEVVLKHQQLFGATQEVKQQLDVARGTLEGLRRAADENKFEYTPEELAMVDENPFIRMRDDRTLTLKEQRRVSMERFGADHRTVQEIDQRIDAIEIEKEGKRAELLKQLQQVRLSQAQNQVRALESTYADLSKQLDTARTQMKELNLKLTEYNQLKEQRAQRLADMTQMTETLTKMQLATARPDAVRVQLQSLAALPRARSFPRYSIFVPGMAFLFLVLTGGLVFARETFDQRLQSPTCCKLLPPTDLLGVIPHAGDDPSSDGQIELVVRRAPHGLLSEALRQLRSEVLDRMERRGYRTLMFVAAQPGAGVSAVASNLAAAAALNNRRVLLIDANFRRSTLSARFELDADAPGIGDLLTEHAELDQAIHATGIDGLDIMPIGRHRTGALEQLESQTLRRALTQLEGRYDMIFIDAPPLSIVGEARVLANRADAVVLVTRAMRDKRGLITRMLNHLHGLRADCLGLVLNDVRSSAGGYFSRNYRAFYEYQNGANGNGHGSANGNGRANGKSGAADHDDNGHDNGNGRASGRRRVIDTTATHEPVDPA